MRPHKDENLLISISQMYYSSNDTIQLNYLNETSYNALLG